MRKITAILMCFIMLGGLSACKTTVQDGPRKIVIDDRSAGGHGNGKFCPPGHAKKGWC